MFLVDVHELQIVLADAVVVCRLEQQVENVGSVLSFKSHNVLILGGAKDLGQGRQVDTEGNVAITSVWYKTFCLEKHGHKGNVGVIHGLQRYARIIAVKVAILDEILDGVDDLKRRRIPHD